jgi:hypothetical protein
MIRSFSCRGALHRPPIGPEAPDALLRAAVAAAEAARHRRAARFASGDARRAAARRAADRTLAPLFPLPDVRAMLAAAAAPEAEARAWGLVACRCGGGAP